MTIKEVEERTGLPRSNIRFYEKEKLIDPARNDKNGYRDYSDKDIEAIKKIAYLRTLNISVENIRSVMSGQISLLEILEKQSVLLREEIKRLNKARSMCERMIRTGNVNFDDLQVERYVEDLRDYWSENKAVFRLDAVRFLYLWGSLIAWAVIAALCLVIAIASYAKLPPEIPVQWRGDVATSLVDRKFIFAFPLACVMIRVLLRPALYAKWAMPNFITEYLTNFLCFVALSLEVFSILFTHGIVKNVLFILIADTVVLLGILA